jgi:hypothetical protein
MKKKQYKVGDWVEVKSREEILRVLDHQGQTDGMPFMPEMFAYCGKRFRIHKRAHKTCDTVFPTRGRKLRNAVHLETRCDGSGHGGCQAGCLIFWKESWLKSVDDQSSTHAPSSDDSRPSHGPAAGSVCTEDTVRAAAVMTSKDSPTAEPRYVCQATQVPYFTEDLVWWDVRQYVEDYVSGNVGLWRMFQSWTFSCYYHVVQSGIGVGPTLRWLYDRLHFLWGGPRYPRRTGTIPADQPTPVAAPLNLREGELIRVKSYEDILKTVNVDGKNRGMYWDAEMVPYCGGTFRVRKSVERLVDERTGRMLNMKTPAVLLEDVTCQGIYSCHRLFCPRALFPFWREIWLERAPANQPTNATLKRS